MQNTTHRLKAGTVAVIAVFAIGLPSAASAQTVDTGPTADQYVDPVVKVQTAAGANDEGTGLSDPVGPLPFTGFDVIAMLAVALAVTGLGLGLQRAVASRPGE